MSDIKVGHYNRLPILEFSLHGAYLDGGEKKILMPKKYVPANLSVGDVVDVFIYYDQDDRLVATTEHPLAEAGQFAFLKVAWVNHYGAFLDWGLTKDLFVPFKEQERKMLKGMSYLVYIYTDDKTGRLVASSKLDKFLQLEADNYHKGQQVSILVWKQTEMGFKVIVDGACVGLVYKNEIFQPVKIGESLKAVIKNVRPDKRLDVALQGDGQIHVEDFSERLLTILAEAGGFMPVGDHTSPDEIYRIFSVSKKTFKRALGMLYRQKKLSIEDSGIRLL